MTTELGKPYLTSWRGDPPHMLKPDIPVWYRFLTLYAGPFLKLYYDVSVGGPYYTPKQLKDPMIRMWRGLLVKRIDALVELEDEVWIIEVAANPGLRSTGQLLSYRALWIRDPKILKPEKMILVAATIEKDLLDVAGMYQIQCFIT